MGIDEEYKIALYQTLIAEAKQEIEANKNDTYIVEKLTKDIEQYKRILFTLGVL